MRQIFTVLWRRKVLILAVLATVVSAGYLGIKAVTPRYTANATLQLQFKPESVIDVQAVIAGFANDSAAVRSEVDVLRSRSLAEKVVDAQQLIDDPEFNLFLRPPGPSRIDRVIEWLGVVDRFNRLIERFGLIDQLPASLTRLLSRAAPSDDRFPPENIRSLVITVVLDRLGVYNDGKSYTINLSFESVDAQKAARIVNAFADIYLRSQLDAKYEASERSAAWLDQKLAALRLQVEAADHAVQKFREANRIVRLPSSNLADGTLSNTQLAQLNEQLGAVRGARVQADAILHEVLARGPGDEISAPAVAAAPVVQSLRIQQVALVARIAQLKGMLGDKHPQVINANAELAELEMRLNQEVSRTVDGLVTAARQARAQEAEIQARLRQSTNVNETSNRAAIRLRQLESEADAARWLFQSFLKGFDRANIQADARSPDARLLSRADVPLWPSYPQVTITLALIIAAALILSLAAVFFAESTDVSYRTVDAIENGLKLPVLGTVPLLTSLRPGRREPHAEAIRNLRSAVAESIRSVLTVLSQSHRGKHPPKIVLVSSAIPREGKTSFAIALGRLTALSGKRVLLIEAEMRRPRLRALLRIAARAGLVELLIGRAALEDVIHRDKASGLDVIPVVSSNPFSTELLGLQKMASLIALAAEQYDLVIIDTPPIAASADAMLLSRSIDAAVLVVQWGRTPRRLVAETVKNLLAANMPLAGLVLTQVDVKAYAGYGNGRHPMAYARRYYAA